MSRNPDMDDCPCVPPVPCATGCDSCPGTFTVAISGFTTFPFTIFNGRSYTVSRGAPCEWIGETPYWTPPYPFMTGFVDLHLYCEEGFWNVTFGIHIDWFVASEGQPALAFSGIWTAGGDESGDCPPMVGYDNATSESAIIYYWSSGRIIPVSDTPIITLS